jgi:hypothetical protein
MQGIGKLKSLTDQQVIRFIFGVVGRVSLTVIVVG